MHDPVSMVDRQVWRASGFSEGLRAVPEETAIALTYNGGTYAVMMGTPQDLGGQRRSEQRVPQQGLVRADRPVAAASAGLS